MKSVRQQGGGRMGGGLETEQELQGVNVVSVGMNSKYDALIVAWIGVLIDTTLGFMDVLQEVSTAGVL
mgnify:CR=1 FL=1